MTRIISWQKLLVLMAIGAMSTTKKQHRLCARGRACVAFSQLGQPAKLSKSNTASVCFACRDRALDRKLEAAQQPKAKARWKDLVPYDGLSWTQSFITESLSLRFNHEGFCDVLYLHRKTLAVTVFVGSGALLEGRVALGLAGEPAFGPPRRPTAGFRRLGGRAQVRQKRRNGAMDPDRRKTPRIVAALPRQPQVRNARARQPELGESYHNQPRPPVGLLGVA